VDAWKVVFYKNVTKDHLVRMFLDFEEQLNNSLPELDKALKQYYDMLAEMASAFSDVKTSGNRLWERYLTERLLADENYFSLLAEKMGLNDMAPGVVQMAREDLNQIQELASWRWEDVRRLFLERFGTAAETLPSWEDFGSREDFGLSRAGDIYEALDSGKPWGDCLEELAAYYRRQGAGLLGKYRAFRWVSRRSGNGRLEGVRNPDKVCFEDLYEYQEEQARVIQNTRQFVMGFPANNVLLYGDRGTGKSSTVKALIHQFGSAGLRLVEMQKQDLRDFPALIEMLSNRALKFIVYLDDLAFVGQEDQYRELKAVLEGSLSDMPANVLIYATSNRRHLVQERFQDKDVTGVLAESEDVRFMDTLQEKLSLADRFGMTVTFIAPDQKRYLAIVRQLAESRGIRLSGEELCRRALNWEIRQNVRSPRTAKQFIDALEGELALREAPDLR
jgi:predicted AAA+ superfamily ATPase